MPDPGEHFLLLALIDRAAHVNTKRAGRRNANVLFLQCQLTQVVFVVFAIISFGYRGFDVTVPP